MPRIFFTLAVFSLLLMCIALVVGLSFGDLNSLKGATPDTITPEQQNVKTWATVHRLTGIFTALVIVLVYSIGMTYFIGTSRWCKEVVETYHLDSNYVARSNFLKRKAFPWAVMGMLVIVGVVALGGAADPATGRPGTENWVTVHLVGALAGVAFIAYAYWTVWNYIQQHYNLTEEMMQEVQRMRKERGLEVSADT